MELVLVEVPVGQVLQKHLRILPLRQLLRVAPQGRCPHPDDALRRNIRDDLHLHLPVSRILLFV